MSFLILIAAVTVASVIIVVTPLKKGFYKLTRSLLRFPVLPKRTAKRTVWIFWLYFLLGALTTYLFV